MKITCQSCNSKYNVADEKVQGKTVKIRCRKCGATIVVHGAASASANGSAHAPGAAAPSPPKEDAQWHVNVSENDQRTMSLTDLVKAYETGVVNVDTFVWTDGMDDWKVLAEVEAVVGVRAPNAVAATASPVGSAAPSQTARGQEEPGDAHNTYEAQNARAGQSEADASSRGAAVSAGPMGESAQAMTPEPRRAAVVKRDARARDLFATNVGEDMQAHAHAAAAILAPPPQLDDGRLTGQRNENSVLFSLEVLTKSAEQRAPQEKRSTKDDSGIIDLKALAAKAESMRPATAVAPDTFVAPLAMASPAFAPFGPMGSSGAAGTSKSKLPLLIGGGAGLALLVAALVVLGMRMTAPTSPDAPGGTLSAPTTPAEPTASAPAATATETSAMTPPPSTAPAPAAAAPKPHPVAGGGAAGAGTARVSAGGGAAAKPASAGGGAAAGAAPAGGGAAAPAAAKKAGDCGCNGDLMCLMKCSTAH